MAGFPLTAWAIRHPLGDEAELVLRGLSSAPGTRTSSPRTEEPILTGLLDELADPCAQACERWGRSRVAVILGSTAPSTEHPLADLATMLEQVRDKTGIVGPAYHVAAAGVGGTKALASAQRLLRASLADAAIVGGVECDRGGLLLVEKHGDALVHIVSSAESTGPLDADVPDEAAVRRAMTQAWAAADNRPLGYVHVHAGPSDPAFAVESGVAQTLCEAAPCCTTATLRSEVSTGAVDMVLAAASLLRGFTPQAQPQELAHDPMLMHAFSSSGQHVSVVLEARL